MASTLSLLLLKLNRFLSMLFLPSGFLLIFPPNLSLIFFKDRSTPTPTSTCEIIWEDTTDPSFSYFMPLKSIFICSLKFPLCSSEQKYLLVIWADFEGIWVAYFSWSPAVVDVPSLGLYSEFRRFILEYTFFFGSWLAIDSFKRYSYFSSFFSSFGFLK